MSKLLIPRLMKIGAGASLALPEALRSLGCARPLIVTDKFITSTGMLKPMLASLDAAAIPHVIFDGAIPDPTTASLDAGLALAPSCDSVVGIGGGSSMDSAKAIAVLAKHSGPLRKFKAPAETPRGLPVLAVPTTAGTGSEVTRVTIVTDSETHEKMLCLGDGLLPDAALVDYELSMGKPYRLTADSGLDALCHAMEAYVSRKATPFTDSLALAALGKITTHLRTACERPDDREAREAMMLAATQAGIAFSNASVTLIHGMSRPIGAKYHVPHGLSNAILLPELTQYSIAGSPSRYADCARTMGFATIADSDTQACTQLVDGLLRLVDDLEVPSLREFGVPKDDFLASAWTMAEQALASGSPSNNPIVPSHDETIRLYERVYAA
jgi:alcohol dehydrogenase class IV